MLSRHAANKEIVWYKCSHCSYQCKRKSYLPQHMLRHPTNEEIVWFKCNQCSFQSKYRSSLKTHLLKHSANEEIVWFKCSRCSYQCKKKSNLKIHMLKHATNEEIDWFNCGHCSYRAKHKSTLKRHMLRHAANEEIVWFKCHHCSYESKLKSHLKLHMLIHKTKEEIDWFQCDHCSYRSKQRSPLKSHMLKHAKNEEIDWFKCSHCSYLAKQKSSLKRHMLTHATNEEIDWFKCSHCSYQSKHKFTLKTHTVKHHHHLFISHDNDIFLLLLGFGFVAIPVMHLVSKAYHYPKSAVLKLTTFNFMTGIVMFATIWAFANLGMTNLSTTRTIFMFWPFYAITDAFQVYQKLSAKHRTCDAVLENCRQQPHDYSTACFRKYCNDSHLLGFSCCSSSAASTDVEFFSMNQLGQHLTQFFASGLAVYVLIFLWEYQLLRTVTWYLATMCTRTRPIPEQDEDKHVLNERIKISKYPESGADYPLVLKDLTRSFGENTAVNGLCVGVHKGECFGLFGPNGSGKSTVFKLITGVTRIGYGSVYVLGENIERGAKKLVSKHTGHCPQVDALLADLTVKETLVIHALIKGVPISDTIRMASTLAGDLQFKDQMNKKIKHLSRGNKRKVSVAMSLIGKPKIILMDEPTMGMDPKSKKVVWKVLAAVRDRGVSFLLTTHSMAECEALCSRLAIIIQGTFNAMGSMALLNEKFSKGYTVTVKLEDCDDLEDELEKMEELEEYFESTFNNVILIERHQQKMTFFTEDQNMKCSTMFKELEKAKVDFPFKDYAIGQSKLEQVFLYFTRRQGA